MSTLFIWAGLRHLSWKKIGLGLLAAAALAGMLFFTTIANAEVRLLVLSRRGDPLFTPLSMALGNAALTVLCLRIVLKLVIPFETIDLAALTQALDAYWDRLDRSQPKETLDLDDLPPDTAQRTREASVDYIHQVINHQQAAIAGMAINFGATS